LRSGLTVSRSRISKPHLPGIPACVNSTWERRPTLKNASSEFNLGICFSAEQFEFHFAEQRLKGSVLPGASRTTRALAADVVNARPRGDSTHLAAVEIDLVGARDAHLSPAPAALQLEPTVMLMGNTQCTVCLFDRTKCHSFGCSVHMPRNVSILTTLREAAQQASHNLENLRFFKPDQDAIMAKLIRDLRSAIPNSAAEREPQMAE